MSRSFPMNGGDTMCTYADNSTMQRDTASAMHNIIKEAVIENLEIEKLLSSSGSGSDLGSGSSSNTFVIADMGCSTGPNTFYAVQTLIEAVKHKYDQASHYLDGNKSLEFQVLFNDQIGNDFNILFASLPHPRNYLAAGVPGSFYGRLFPSSSVHIAYTSYSLHWMSKVPEEVEVRDSATWNAGRIHYVGASDAVVKAYSDKFEEDMKIFFGARAREIVPGGLVVILMLCVPHRDVQHGGSKMYSFLESIFLDMVKEGVLEQEQVDSFNFPNFFPCKEDVRRVVDKNGCFEIVRMEMVNDMSNIASSEKMDPGSLILHFRAIIEEIIVNHFGKETVDHLFVRAMQKKLEISHFVDSPVKFSGLLFLVLKRKLL